MTFFGYHPLNYSHKRIKAILFRCKTINGEFNVHVLSSISLYQVCQLLSQMVFIKCTNFVSTPKLKLFFPGIGYSAKKWGSRKEGKDIIGRKLEGKMPVDAPWTDGILRRIHFWNYLPNFLESFRRLNLHKIFFFL